MRSGCVLDESPTLTRSHVPSTLREAPGGPAYVVDAERHVHLHVLLLRLAAAVDVGQHVRELRRALAHELHVGAWGM